jgi:hypothetical protein
MPADQIPRQRNLLCTERIPQQDNRSHFLAEILIWVITSSRRAFSLQAYCVIASVCMYPTTFFCVHLLSPPPSLTLSQLGRLTNKTRQLPKRDPRRQCARLPTPLDTLIPAALFVIGQTFIVTSTWSLSITTTFLGDYFGILMDARVEGFPFNVLRVPIPIYVGSMMCFAATALWCVSEYHASRSLKQFNHLLQVRAFYSFVHLIVRVHCGYERLEV